jgi:hypothetical protein
MNSGSGPEPDLARAAGLKVSDMSILGQVTVLVLGFAATGWGLFCVFGAAFPGPCGENVLAAALLVMESWVLDVPVGLLALFVGVFVKKGSSRMRRMCIVTALVTLSFPVLASFLLQLHHCP